MTDVLTHIGNVTEPKIGLRDGVWRVKATREKELKMKPQFPPFETERGGVTAKVDIIQKMDMWQPMVRLTLTDRMMPSRCTYTETTEVDIWLTKRQARELAFSLIDAGSELMV